MMSNPDIPKSWQDLVAIAGAFVCAILAIQLVAPLLERVEFVHDEVRSYVNGGLVAIFMPARTLIRDRLLHRPRSMLPPGRSWVAIGLVAAFWLVLVHQLSALLGAIAGLQALNAAEIPATADAVSAAAFMVATPLTFLTAMVAGLLVAHRDDGRVGRTLLLMAAAYGVVQATLGLVLADAGTSSRSGLGLMTSIGYAIGLSIPLALALTASLIGLLAVRWLPGPRSAAGLLSSVYRLPPDKLNKVQQLVDRLANRGRS